MKKCLTGNEPNVTEKGQASSGQTVNIKECKLLNKIYYMLLMMMIIAGVVSLGVAS